MNCFVKVSPVAGAGGNSRAVRWVGQVITRDDYHNRGPAAKTHQTAPFVDADAALAAAREWAEEHGLSIYSADDIAKP